MATTRGQTQLTVDELAAAVKRLSPAELHEFTQRLAEWQGRNGSQGQAEAALLECIMENSQMSSSLQRRFNRLRRKHQAESLTDAEAEELQALWQRVEQMNAARLQALTELAQLRGTSVQTLLGELGLSENRHVF
ncbi:MAG TPA: hypothetical protein VJ783_07365 [Pirellulales bacterium]|nr:hypothetical protein [Pirellulales bacterium]